MSIVKQRAFKRFVEEIYEVYKNKVIRTSGSSATNPSTQEIGNEGEFEVRIYLTNKEYVVQLSPQSRTPADIYGFKQCENFLHIAGIQAKATITKQRAHNLSQTERNRMKRVPEIIKQIYIKSNHSGRFNPENLPLAITADYMEVVNGKIVNIEHINGLQTGRVSEAVINRNLNSYYSL